MKKLPIGIQTFSEIINDDLLYVDKTKLIYDLIKAGKYFFLSRPRRFGKSLLVSTLKEIFSGNKELFKGLYIYDKHDWKSYPVIHVDFSGISRSDAQTLTESLSSHIDDIAKKNNISLSKKFVADKFKQLIEMLNEKTNNKVAILIDEYDRPIIDHITNLTTASENREVLKQFYSVLKGSDQYIKFVLITGISKFTKVSLFSVLDNLDDITLDERFSNIVGLTQEEIEHYFNEHISVLMTKLNLTKEQLLEKIRYWYNGYSWNGIDTLYNPFSLLNLFTKNKFSNYWFETATPTFLINLIKTKKYDVTQLENTVIGEDVFSSYDIDNMELNPLLFQTGYLTINKITKHKYTGESLYSLTSPNFEVKQALLRYIIASFINEPVPNIAPLYSKMIDYLIIRDLDSFIKQIRSLFAKLPYTLHIPKEAYYHSIFYMILVLMGAKMDAELLTDKGRIDGVIEFNDKIYIIEFKYGKIKTNINALLEEAIEQINDKKYYEKYLNTNKEIILFAVGFVDKKIEFKTTSLS